MKRISLLLIILLIQLTACQATTPISPTPTQSPAPPTPVPAGASIKVIGMPEVVYKWDTDRCADDMLPDLPTRALRGPDGTLRLIISSTTNYRLVGADFDSLEPDCSPVMLSDRDRNPANYNHSEWVAAAYTEDGQTVHAIIHNEYHGDQAGSVWQADLDFNPEQGFQGWTYQAWNGASYADMTYNASRGEWAGSRSVCLIGPQWMHPDVTCEPARTWTSPITGKVTISGKVHDQDANGGDGVTAQILKGDVELWSVTIENGDMDGQAFDLEVDVQEGEQIHFRLDARGDAGWDSTFFNPGIDIGAPPCPSRRHDVCTLISLTYAVSTDGGTTFTQPPAPDHLLANFPHPYDPNWMRAIWQPSNIVKNPKDGYYYALLQFDEHPAAATGGTQGMCIMRTETLDDPTSWRAWGGMGFNMSFINPYVETDTNPEEHTCELVSPENGALSYGLSYNTYLEKFVAVGASGWPEPGFYYSLSDDLVHWTPKTLIMKATMGFMNGNQTPFDAYSTLIDHDSPSPSFDVTGQSAYLYYSIFTNKDPWSIDLVRVRVEFEK